MHSTRDRKEPGATLESEANLMNQKGLQKLDALFVSYSHNATVIADEFEYTIVYSK